MEILYRQLYNLIGTCFRVGLVPFFRVDVNGIKKYSESPSSLIVANHKRDLDSILVVSAFYFRHGYSNPGKMISFMGDENLFQPGFLGDWLPAPMVKKMLKRLSLNGILQRLNAYPIGKLNFRSIPIYEVFQIVKREDGDCKLDKLFEDEALSKLVDKGSISSGVKTISDYLMRKGYQRDRISLKSVKSPYQKVVKQYKLENVKEQLDHFIDILNEGEILYITPEGRLSEDGNLGSLRDSLHILIEETEPETTVVPTNITYDYLTIKRPAISINVGDEISGLSRLDRKERSRLIREKIISLTTVNLGHLASRRLVDKVENGEDTIIADELEKGIKNDMKVIEEDNLFIDDKIKSPSGFQKRFDNFIDYCLDKGVFRKTENSGDKFRFDEKLGYNRDEIPRGYKRDPIRYCANELLIMIEYGLIGI